MQGYRAISSHLAGWTGTIAGFVRDLDRRGARYLAFTHFNALKLCPYRYYLECVERVRLRPQPDYFVKGHIFHEAVARYYRGLARKRSISLDTLHAFIDRHDRPDQHHLKNAVELAIHNSFSGWEVIGVEEPFVLSLGKKLPPCFGVIDLILGKDSRYAVVDHKTGRQFNGPDDLQLILYQEYVRRRYGAKECAAIFDEYRWVNNLDRVRKPAFQRTEVKLTPKRWDSALRHITRGYRRMRLIEKKGDAPGTGQCFMCPFKDQCPKASLGTYSGW